MDERETIAIPETPEMTMRRICDGMLIQHGLYWDAESVGDTDAMRLCNERVSVLAHELLDRAIANPQGFRFMSATLVDKPDNPKPPILRFRFKAFRTHGDNPVPAAYVPPTPELLAKVEEWAQLMPPPQPKTKS